MRAPFAGIAQPDREYLHSAFGGLLRRLDRIRLLVLAVGQEHEHLVAVAAFGQGVEGFADGVADQRAAARRCACQRRREPRGKNRRRSSAEPSAPVCRRRRSARRGRRQVSSGHQGRPTSPVRAGWEQRPRRASSGKRRAARSNRRRAARPSRSKRRTAAAPPPRSISANPRHDQRSAYPRARPMQRGHQPGEHRIGDESPRRRRAF